MKKDEMFAVAREELTHIPKGDYVQGVLRASYWVMRLNSLGKKAESRRSGAANRQGGYGPSAT